MSTVSLPGTPKISVIVPVYNAERHLEALLDSVLGQSETSLEILAVDDGSTDRSLQILEQRADPRLVVLTQANQGVSAARNHALGKARGKWIAFADSDDWLSPETLQSWSQFAEEGTLDLLIGNGFDFAKDPGKIAASQQSESSQSLQQPQQPKPLLHLQPWGKILTGADWITHCIAEGEWPHYVWLQLVRRELITGARFVEGIVHEDILWTLQVALEARRIGFYPQPLYGYRKNAESIMRSPSPAVIISRAKSYLKVMAHIARTADANETPLRKALLRHLNREGGHFMGLIRKRIQDRAIQRELSREFFQLDLSRRMFAGATNGNEFWRALRCCLVAFRLRF